MNGQELVEAVREREATALHRLGSDKYLVAATGADLETGPVLRTVAAERAAGRDVFERWADEESGDVAAAFERAAETESDHHERVVGSLSDADGDADGDPDAVAGGEPVDVADGDAPADSGLPADGDPTRDALLACEGTAERVGAGFVGRPLVADRTLLQVVSFFVNEADDARADLARELRSAAQDRLEEGAALLDDVCEGDDNWERARSAAERVVADAYDDYARRLEEMGVDPKPVC